MDVNVLSKEITKQMKDFSKEFVEELKKDIEKIANECAEELRQTSPRSNKVSKKRYADGWTVKKAYENDEIIRYRVLNKNKPQLTHLLEFGHAKRNGGRVEARPHIKKAETNAREKLLKKVKGM